MGWLPWNSLQSLLHCMCTHWHPRTQACCTHVCAEDSTNTYCSGTACQECCLPGWSCWGQTRVSQPVLPSLVHGTRLIMAYMNHTGPHFQYLLQSVTCDMQERMLYTIAAASAKRLHALVSAGVKQLVKEIIQFYTSCFTTEQAMHCIIEVILLDEMHGFVGQVWGSNMQQVVSRIVQ